jgi:hypothetical protein
VDSVALQSGQSALLHGGTVGKSTLNGHVTGAVPVPPGDTCAHASMAQLLDDTWVVAALETSTSAMVPVTGAGMRIAPVSVASYATPTPHTSFCEAAARPAHTVPCTSLARSAGIGSP